MVKKSRVAGCLSRFDTHGLKNRSEIPKQTNNHEQHIRKWSISIRFGCDGVQKIREDMPRGPCHGPEARKNQTNIEIIDFRKI
jgi:hypothetical protein